MSEVGEHYDFDLGVKFKYTKYEYIHCSKKHLFNEEGKTRPKVSRGKIFSIRGTFGKSTNLEVTPTDGSEKFGISSDDHCIYLIAFHPTKPQFVAVGFDDIYIYSCEQKPGERLSPSDFKIVTILKDRIFNLKNATIKERRRPLNVSSIEYQEDGKVLEIIHNFGTNLFATDSI
jgi:hypothetical protein